MNSHWTASTKRYLIDTNVLLAGLLLPKSPSFYFLQLVKNKEIVGYIAENTVNEAYTVLNRVRHNTGIDASEMFNVALAQSNILSLPFRGLHSLKDIATDGGLMDRIIKEIAHDAQLAICTNDIEDFAKRPKDGLFAISPMNVLPYFSESADNCFYMTGLRRNKGLIYTRFYPNAAEAIDRGLTDDQCSIFNASFGDLFYSREYQSFIFQGRLLPSVSVKIGRISGAGKPIHISLTYDSNVGIGIYCNAHWKSGFNRIRWSPTKEPMSGEVSVGHCCGSMTIRFFCTYPAHYSHKMCNRIASQKVNPPTIETMPLEASIKLLYKKYISINN